MYVFEINLLGFPVRLLRLFPVPDEMRDAFQEMDESLCAGIDRYLQQGLGLPVEVGDPARQLDDGSSLDPDVAARAAVALGLALDAPERS